MKKFGFKTQMGFSTIEVIVGLSVLVLVAMAGGALSQVANNSSAYSDQKQSLQSLGNTIMEHLKNETTCAAAISGNSITNIMNPSATGASITIRIPNLQAGPTMDSEILNPNSSAAERQILPRKLQVNSLRLADGMLTASTATEDTYIANVYLEVQTLDGMTMKPVNLGSVMVGTAAGGNTIVNCRSKPQDDLKTTCVSFGCNYDETVSPAVCNCLKTTRVCIAPGSYPVRFTDGNADCRQLGSSTACPGNTYLVGVGIEENYCAPAPDTCPAGTSLTGAGSAIPGLSKCLCINAGESWTNGSCQSGTPTPTPTATPSNGCVLSSQTSVRVQDIGSSTSCDTNPSFWGYDTNCPANVAGTFYAQGACMVSTETRNAGGSYECQITSLECEATPPTGACGAGQFEAGATKALQSACESAGQMSCNNNAGTYTGTCVYTGAGYRACCDPASATPTPTATPSGAPPSGERCVGGSPAPGFNPPLGSSSAGGGFGNQCRAAGGNCYEYEQRVTNAAVTSGVDRCYINATGVTGECVDRPPNDPNGIPNEDYELKCAFMNP